MWYRAKINRKGMVSIRMIYGDTPKKAKQTILDDFSKYEKIKINLEQLSKREMKNSVLFC